jgi:ankyrin repeat protein
LFVGSISGRRHVVKCLHSSGADINLRDGNRQSPLFLASMSEHFDVVKCLLSSGADINLHDENRQSTWRGPDIDATNNGDCLR